MTLLGPSNVTFSMPFASHDRNPIKDHHRQTYLHCHRHHHHHTTTDVHHFLAQSSSQLSSNLCFSFSFLFFKLLFFFHTASYLFFYFRGNTITSFNIVFRVDTSKMILKLSNLAVTDQCTAKIAPQNSLFFDTALQYFLARLLDAVVQNSTYFNHHKKKFIHSQIITYNNFTTYHEINMTIS